MTRLPLRKPLLKKPLLGKLPPQLITRADLRMALTAGLSAGLLISLGLPDPIYGPMAVGSVLGGTLGASRTLGIQRMQGTVLGGLIVMVGIPTMGSIVPLPIAIAVSLACTRLFGGALGLRSGYKVAGLVVTVGWTIHQAEIFTWLPARLIDTLIGVLLSWIAVSCFWPSRAIQQRQELSHRLFASFASAFRERAELLGQGMEIGATNRLDRRDQLLAQIFALETVRPIQPDSMVWTKKLTTPAVIVPSKRAREAAMTRVSVSSMHITTARMGYQMNKISPRLTA